MATELHRGVSRYKSAAPTLRMWSSWFARSTISSWRLAVPRLAASALRYCLAFPWPCSSHSTAVGWLGRTRWSALSQVLQITGSSLRSRFASRSAGGSGGGVPRGGASRCELTLYVCGIMAIFSTKPSFMLGGSPTRSETK